MKQKRLRKLVSMILAVVMVLSMSITGFAASEFIITIENSVTGSTYSAYKVFDATYSTITTTDDNGEEISETIVAYTISTSDAWYNLVSNEDSPFTLTATTTSGTYNVSVKTDVTDDEVANWFNEIVTTDDNGEVTSKIPSEENKVTGVGNGGSLGLDVGEAGYYYITTTTGSLVTVTTADPTATVVDKNQVPGGDLKKTADDTEAQIGDSVTYTITSSVPAYDGETEITNYKFVDTLSAGLTAPDADYVTVQILKPATSTTDGAFQISKNEDKYYTVAETLGNTENGNYIVVEKVVNSDGKETGETTITITYDPTSIDGYPADAVIMITYAATVNSEAAYENENTVNQTWTSEKTGTEDTETVYTYGFNLVKKAGSEDGETLEGAEFQLSDGEYVEKTVGSESEFNPANTTYYTRDENSGGYSVVTENDKYDSEQTYYVASDMIGFVVSTRTDDKGNTTEIYTVSTDKDSEDYTTTITAGDVIIFGLDADKEYILTETEAPNGYNRLTETVSVTVGQEDKYNVETGINNSSTNVLNNAGSELPSTGGIGTTIFYIVGGVLVLGAAVLFVTRKRLSSEN